MEKISKRNKGEQKMSITHYNEEDCPQCGAELIEWRYCPPCGVDYGAPEEGI